MLTNVVMTFGILATLLPVAPRIFLRDLLHLKNVVLITCYIPSVWNKAMFIMPRK